jgi:hypothetical protein
LFPATSPVAGVHISRAKRITAAHNLIHDVPRAGICIGDGTWAGHLIEFNHIYDAVRATGDHGGYRQALDLDDGASNYRLYNNVRKDMAISIRPRFGENERPSRYVTGVYL